MAKSQAVVAQPQQEVVVRGEALPEWVKAGPARGAENVTTNDMVIPRIELVQSLSPCRKKTDPAYIEGAEEGMLYNNVTRELYQSEVTVVPVYYAKQYLVWKDRKAGGGGSNGFRGAFATEQAARAGIAQLNEDALDVVDTAQHFVLVKTADGWEEAVISMSKSKMKVSKRWNSLIRMTGADSFCKQYRIMSATETNARNESYYNFSVTPGGFVAKEVYERAEKLYDTIRSGDVRVSTAYDTDDSESDTEY